MVKEIKNKIGLCNWYLQIHTSLFNTMAWTLNILFFKSQVLIWQIYFPFIKLNMHKNSISATAPNPSSFLTEYHCYQFDFTNYSIICTTNIHTKINPFFNCFVCFYINHDTLSISSPPHTLYVLDIFPWQLMCLTCFFVNYHIVSQKQIQLQFAQLVSLRWVFWLFPSSCYDIRYILSHAYVQVILQHIFQFIWRACYKKYTHP